MGSQKWARLLHQNWGLNKPRKGAGMSEKELERILAEEHDEEKVWKAIEEYFKSNDTEVEK